MASKVAVIHAAQGTCRSCMTSRRDCSTSPSRNYFVGQGVGLIDSVRTARQVMEDFLQEFVAAVSQLESCTQAQ